MHNGLLVGLMYMYNTLNIVQDHGTLQFDLFYIIIWLGWNWV